MTLTGVAPAAGRGRRRPCRHRRSSRSRPTADRRRRTRRRRRWRGRSRRSWRQGRPGPCRPAPMSSGPEPEAVAASGAAAAPAHPATSATDRTAAVMIRIRSARREDPAARRSGPPGGSSLGGRRRAPGPVGVVGAEGVVPDPLLPPMFGQSAVEPEPCWRGAARRSPEPPDGAVVLGAADGSGLAAETAAAAPPTRSSADSAAVMTVRRMPEPLEVGAAGSIAGVGTSAGAWCRDERRGGPFHGVSLLWVAWSGCLGHCMRTSLERLPGTNPDPDAGSARERGMRAPRSVVRQRVRNAIRATDLRAAALRRVDRVEEPARDAAEATRVDEPGRRGQPLPRGVAERVRHPRVAAVRVVLDDDEPAARPQVRGERADDRDLPVARHVMEAVGRDQPVQLGEVERTGQVGDSVVSIVVREARPDRRLVRPERPPRPDRRRRSARPDRAGRRAPA